MTWPAPTSSDPAILRPSRFALCPSAVTCASFEAVSPGAAARIEAAAPGGIICSGVADRCAGVSAPVFLIAVTVEATAGPASLTLRPAGG